MTASIGKPIDRKDARLKVTGTAKYAAEFEQKNLAYGFPVRSEIANGRITMLDTSAALKAEGVRAVLTHENAPRLKPLKMPEIMQTGGIPGEFLLPLQDAQIHYFGQYIALVVAETYEQARQAARLVKVSYQKAPTLAVSLEKEKSKGYQPKSFFGFEDVQINQGNAAQALDSAATKIERTYTTPTENHHPMEPHATIAAWDGADKITFWDATQGVKGSQGVAAYILGLKPENVRVVSPFVGGGFGSKGLQWMHPIMAAMGAQAVKRPLKIVLTRQMMTTNVGRRGATIQQVSLGAGSDGKLIAIRHLNNTYTNLHEFFEPSGLPTKVLYDSPNLEIAHNVVRLNIATPTPMRAPGETPGTFALESAMDELAHELKIDPIELRLLNIAKSDPTKKLVWSSNLLGECYRLGAEKFGWSKRNAVPRANRDGKYLVGMGMATATYPAGRAPASARVMMLKDGSVIVMSATQDIGTGTYTVLAQIAADALGVPVERVRVEIGDSNFPNAPVSGGSMTAASVGPAVQAACEMLKKQVAQLAISNQKSPLSGVRLEQISFGDGSIFLTGDSAKSETYTAILNRSDKAMVEACATAAPAMGRGKEGEPNPSASKSKQDGGGGQEPGSDSNKGQFNGSVCNPAQTDAEQNSDNEKYSFHSFGAQFAEVRVDEDLGIIRVSRFTSVQDIGRVLNEKTARSQVIGGVIYGIGQALMEETQYDERWANPVTRMLADYHVPVNLDVPPIDVFFIGKEDPHISTIGARGVGEIGITGVAAAIANAVFNATGKRLRDLPLTPDKLL